MLQVALAQVRLNARRFIAVSLAVMIAVGFLTATLIINSSSKASLTQSIGEGYRNADLVVTPEVSYDDPPTVITQQMADAVRETDGIAGTYAVISSYVNMDEGKKTSFAELNNTAEDRALFPVDIVTGDLPAAGEVAVDQDTADRLGLSLGSVLALTPNGEQDAAATELTTSAIVSTSRDPMKMGAPQLYAATATVEQFPSMEQGFRSVQAALEPGATLEDVQAALEQTLTDAGFTGLSVRTAAEQTEATVAGYTGGEDQLTVILLAFAAVALLVCALVVSNTFSVLVAQRTRELALLRCIGAARSQIRRSVIVEALLVGVVASIAGVLVAVALVGATVAYLRNIPESGFATLSVSPLSVVVGLGVGVLMTVLAALVPARAATAVAPLAALRPADDVRAGTRRGKIRLVSGLVLLAGGAALLAAGAVRSDLLLALPGGILSFVGVLMCATLFIPSLVRAVGSLAAPLGVPGKLAAVNAVRNPQRTSATSSALLIGVTLVAMMMTGAATARDSLSTLLSQEFPVDVAISGGLSDGSPFTGDDADIARAVPGVTSAALLPVAGTTDIDGYPAEVYALDPADRGVLQDTTVDIAPGSILMPQGTKEKTVTVSGAKGDVTLDVVLSESGAMQPLVAGSTADELGGVPKTTDPDVYLSGPQLWLSVDDALTSNELLNLQSDLAEAMGVEDYMISGAAIVRASFEQVIDVLLMVVTGLLGVAVVIALVGVANTLSLSVLERTRESSLLRALGLTRGQLRGMLALEAVLIAGVAALFGTVLGALYGWLGAQSALGAFSPVAASIPWGQLGVVLAVALLAGLAASVLPARRAARLSPVAGLAAD